MQSTHTSHRSHHLASLLVRALAAAGLATVVYALPLSAVNAATSFPNDPFLTSGDQWGLTGAPASIHAPAAWCVSTGAGITVADVDTGADFAHPDLAGKLVAGAQFLGGTAGYPGAPTAGPGDPAAVSDGHFHGTFTAGIIGADTGNGQGIAAVAPDARILVVKVLDNKGSGYDSDVASGIRWAVDNGAQVINVSIGPDIGVVLSLTSNIPDALHYAATHDVAVAVAAGNSSLPLGAYQGVGADALVVGALGPDATIAPYSNNGGGVTIFAPGGTGATSSDQSANMHQNIVSTTLGGRYATSAGTSFATPHVAGTLALLRAAGMNAADARQRILGTAVRRNGVPDLDAAAALGATGTCGTPAAAAPPPPAGSGPSRAPQPPAHTQPPAAHTAPPAPPTATPAPTPAPTLTPAPTDAAAADAAVPSPPASAAGGPQDLGALVPPPTQGGGVGRGAIVVAALVGGSGVAAGGGAIVLRVLRRRPSG
jgi:serine protease